MQMQGLNDRLASYIDRVRAQEMEINRLNNTISTIEETKTTEVTSVKHMYDKELAHARKALDETAKERAKYQILAEKLERENRELKSDLAAKEKNFTYTDRELKNLQNRYNTLQQNFERDSAELQALRPEIPKLTKKLNDAKKNLEDETLRRVDLENQLQTQQENLKFENSMLEQQLNETRTRKHIEISEIDSKLQGQYEEKLQQALKELRDAYEKQIADNRDEFNRVYEAKLQNLQEKLNLERTNSAGNSQEVMELTTKVTGLTSRNLELESSNASLQQRMADLIKDMEDAAKQHRQEMARKDAEIRSKDEQMAEMLKDYKDLMEIKVALDMEIAAYRKMLEGEEARLGLSPSGSQESTPVGRGRKRRRIEEEEITEFVSTHSGTGDIVIEPIDKDGKCIRIRNKSDEDINIGGWTLSNVSGEMDSSYKFHRTTTIAPGAICTVWSSDCDQEHTPPTNLVMKRGKWTIGDVNVTTLVDKDGEEHSSRQSQKGHRLTGSYREGEFYRQGNDPDNKCIIM